MNSRNSRKIPKNVLIYIKARKIIKRFEGFEPNVYKDCAGHPTIGYGHKITAGEDFTGRTLSDEEASELLVLDILAKADITPYVIPGLEENQRDALTSLCYNIGVGNFSKSTVLKKVNEGDLLGAFEYFGHWRRAGGEVVKGLVKRRFAELFVFADRTLDPSDSTAPSAQWGMEPMVITDGNWGLLTPALREEAVQIYEGYKRDE